MNKEELLKKVSNWLVQLEQTNLNYVSEEEAESIRSEWQQKSYEVLQWVAAILQEDPFCFDAILARIKINCWVLENNAAILTDAEFIARHSEFKENKLVGYDWLVWVYQYPLAMPKKALEYLDEELIELDSMKMKRSEKDNKKGRIYEIKATIYRQENNDEEALNNELLSIKFYPYNHYLNGFVGIELLKAGRFQEAFPILKTFYRWMDECGTEQVVDIAETIKRAYKENKLNDTPALIGIYFGLIRNNYDRFEGYDFENKSFIKIHEVELNNLTRQFPNCSVLWAVQANMYFFANNFKLALQAYRNYLLGDEPFFESYFDRINICCENTGTDFFSIDYPFRDANIQYDYQLKSEDANTLYNCVTHIDQIYREDSEIKFLDSAIAIGLPGFEMYKAYFINGEGSPYCNQDHIFAMYCTNFANLFLCKSREIENIDEKKAICKKCAEIHIIGYQLSPYYENCKNTIDPAMVAEMYDVVLDYIDELIKNYSIFIEFKEDWFRMYHQQIIACKSLQKNDKAIQVYTDAKKLCITELEKDDTLLYDFLPILFDALDIFISSNSQRNFCHEQLRYWLNLPLLKTRHLKAYMKLFNLYKQWFPENEIEFEKPFEPIFSDSYFSNQDELDKQYDNFIKLFELTELFPDSAVQEFWSDGWQVTMDNQYENNDVYMLTLTYPQTGHYYRMFYYDVAVTSTKILGMTLKKKSKNKKGISVLYGNLHSGIDKLTTLYDKNVPEADQIMFMQLWQWLLYNAEVGLYYKNIFDCEIQPKDIYRITNLTLVKKKFYDFDNGDMVIQENNLQLLFGRENIKSSTPAVVRVGIESKGYEQYDVRNFFFWNSDVETPTHIDFRYWSSVNEERENIKNRYVPNSQYVFIFDWELWEEALIIFKKGESLITKMNSEFLREPSN